MRALKRRASHLAMLLAKLRAKRLRLSATTRARQLPYFQAISNGVLDETAADETSAVIDEVNSNLRGESSEISLSRSVLDSLVSAMGKYAKQPCEANDHKFKKPRRLRKKSRKSSLETLEPTLRYNGAFCGKRLDRFAMKYLSCPASPPIRAIAAVVVAAPHAAPPTPRSIGPRGGPHARAGGWAKGAGAVLCATGHGSLLSKPLKE